MNLLGSSSKFPCMLILFLFIKFAGHNVQPRKVISPKRAFASSNENSSNINNHSLDKLHFHPGSSDNIRAPNHQSDLVDDSENFTDNGNASRPLTVNSRIANLSGADYEKISSQQALRRTLPPSLQPFVPSTRLNHLAENMGSSTVHENFYLSAGPSVIKSKGYLPDHFNRGKKDEVIAYENSVTRILPPSLMHGNAISSNQFVSSIDASHRPMVGEERQTENDERLIYQAALEVFLAVMLCRLILINIFSCSYPNGIWTFGVYWIGLYLVTRININISLLVKKIYFYLLKNRLSCS